ncbi:MAG: hypothetical protein V4707_09105 [Pseudomonadota bacterium]
MIDQPPPTQDAYVAEMSRRIEACGLSSGDIRIEYRNELQDYAVVISAASPTDEVLACLAELETQAGLVIEIPDEQVWMRDGPFSMAASQKRWAEMEPAYREMSRKWLDDHSLLAGLPNYDPSRQTLATFAKAMEAHCGLPEGSALRADDDQLTLIGGSGLSLEQVSCLMAALGGSNLYDHGVAVWITGQ